MNELAFDIQQLKKNYNERTILSIDSLAIEKGKVHALIGPNGAGKSTFLRLLALLDRPTEANLKVFGFDYCQLLREKIKWQRRMTIVLQKPVLFNQSVFNNVAYALKVRRIPRMERKKRVEETLDWVGMGSMARQNALTLSGGEAQRVALARAIIFRPDVLFLDEPTANLDPANVTMIENLIKKINQELGTTIVMVTHNLFQARRLAHKTIVLMEGSVVEMGETENIFTQPQDTKTRSFFAGEMIY